MGALEWEVVNTLQVPDAEGSAAALGRACDCDADIDFCIRSLGTSRHMRHRSRRMRHRAHNHSSRCELPHRPTHSFDVRRDHAKPFQFRCALLQKNALLEEFG